MDDIVSNLRQTYPSYAIAQKEEWVSCRLDRPDIQHVMLCGEKADLWDKSILQMFNNAGGAMGAMTLIHASITEYLIFFGTPLGTEGHSGRHTADDYFHILQGEEWAFAAGSLVKEVRRQLSFANVLNIWADASTHHCLTQSYPVGTVHHLPRGQIKQYKIHDGAWAMEYARGESDTTCLCKSSHWAPPISGRKHFP